MRENRNFENKSENWKIKMKPKDSLGMICRKRYKQLWSDFDQSEFKKKFKVLYQNFFLVLKGWLLHF